MRHHTSSQFQPYTQIDPATVTEPQRTHRPSWLSSFQRTGNPDESEDALGVVSDVQAIPLRNTSQTTQSGTATDTWGYHLIEAMSVNRPASDARESDDGCSDCATLAMAACCVGATCAGVAGGITCLAVGSPHHFHCNALSSIGLTSLVLTVGAAKALIEYGKC